MINIIFDFDGVIINSHKIKTDAFNNVFKSYGKNIGLLAKKIHLENIGKSRYFKFKYILKKIIKSKNAKKEIAILDKKFDQFVEKKIKKISPSKYLIKFLINSKNSRNIYISTGTPQTKIIKILKEKKLLKYFTKVYGSPNSKINHIKRIKKNNNKCFFIGDSYEDFISAKKTNIKFIMKINSENISLRKKIKFSTINSFKFLENKLKY